MVTKENEPSLVAYLARELAGRAATGTTVTGANGFSFGTPEFRKVDLGKTIQEHLEAIQTENNTTEDIANVHIAEAIDRYYALFGKLYLWASPVDAFTVVTVP
jgi:hypothetical protein